MRLRASWGTPAPVRRPAFLTICGMVTSPLNAVNRGVYIGDNLPFLQALNDECIDLVCIDPPFAKNETFDRKNDKSPGPLKPPLTEQERDTDLALLQRWGIRNEAHANAIGIDWPATEGRQSPAGLIAGYGQR